jgi:Toprim domain
MGQISDQAADLARRLGQDAEAVCRHYLSKGRREGRYWLVGDVRNEPGRSLYVRLSGEESGPGAAGKWTDAATGDHGDLLDLIALGQGHDRLCETLDEARRFLSLPRPDPSAEDRRHRRDSPAATGSPEAARRLFAASKPITGTVAEAYLRNRGIATLHGAACLRFHPHCYYRPGKDDPPDAKGAWPALIAAVTDDNGSITGVHRTWLDPVTATKAPVASPRRAMGHLLGHGVRFGVAREVMAAGEGIETIASLRSALPSLPMAAALSANHLAALILPVGLRRLYIAVDDDEPGHIAAERLSARAEAAGIEAVKLRPTLSDFNDDLRLLEIDALRASVRVQLAAEDVARFWVSEGMRRG